MCDELHELKVEATNVAADEDAPSVQKLFEDYSKLDRHAYAEQIEILEKIVKLDSSNCEFYYLLYQSRKLQRKSLQSSSNNSEGRPMVPSKQEIIAIAKASDLDPDNPKIIISRSNCMLDFLKHHGVRWSGNACFGKGYFFMSSKEIIESAESEARRALEIDPESESTNISVSEIYTSGLPPSSRNYPFAKLCLERAVEFNNESSKAYGRLASFCCTIEKDFEAGETYFLRSIEHDTDKQNVSALLDLLQTIYMTSNSDKFENLIESQINDPGWDDSKKAKIWYVRGIRHFLQEENLQATECWFNAYNLDKQIVDQMMYFDRNCYRYHLPDNLSSTNIFLTFGQYKRNGTFKGEKRQILIKFRLALGAQREFPKPINYTKPKVRAFGEPSTAAAATNNNAKGECNIQWKDICTEFDEDFRISSSNYVRPSNKIENEQ